MFRFRFKTFAMLFAGCLSAFAAPSQARDISLPKYSWNAGFGSYHKNVDFNPAGRAGAVQVDPLTEILAVSAVDVWGRIRSGFGIQPLDNQLLNNHINYYSKRGEYFQRTTKRAERYLFHIVQECERRNMPTELALLPFIESSFNPHAHSPAKAEGLWQFIPSTGKQYSLTQNTFQDKRRDIIASTNAALTYLQRLYDMFGDWQLALSSYNWGEGNVMRATRKAEAAGREISFNGIFPYMPAETRNYVPKLLAVKAIVSRPELYGIRLPDIDNRPYFVKIGKTKDIDVAVAARLAEMSNDEFKALNPQYRYVIPGGNSVHILLPKDKAERFQRNLLSWSRPLSSWTSYQVTQARERIEDIAQKLNVPPEAIRQANNIPMKKALKFGSTILVPRTPSFNRDIAPGVLDSAYIAYASDYTPAVDSEDSCEESTDTSSSSTSTLRPSQTFSEKPRVDTTPKRSIWTSPVPAVSERSSYTPRPYTRQERTPSSVWTANKPSSDVRTKKAEAPVQKAASNRKAETPAPKAATRTARNSDTADRKAKNSAVVSKQQKNDRIQTVADKKNKDRVKEIKRQDRQAPVKQDKKRQPERQTAVKRPEPAKKAAASNAKGSRQPARESAVMKVTYAKDVKAKGTPASAKSAKKDVAKNRKK